MKKHLTFLKRASLMCLAVAALFGTCLTLTSCGSGGGEEDNTPEIQAAKYMENKTLDLWMNQGLCTVYFSDRQRGSSTLSATVQYGGAGGASVEGKVFIINAAMHDEDLSTARIKIALASSTITSNSDFKTWWGVASDGRLVFSGETFIDLAVARVASNFCEGSFNAVSKIITKDNDGTETETEKELVGAGFELKQQ